MFPTYAFCQRCDCDSVWINGRHSVFNFHSAEHTDEDGSIGKDNHYRQVTFEDSVFSIFEISGGHGCAIRLIACFIIPVTNYFDRGYYLEWVTKDAGTIYFYDKRFHIMYINNHVKGTYKIDRCRYL